MEKISKQRNQKIFTIVLFIFSQCFMTVSGQVTFDKGYVINNSGVKIECLIKNYDWRVNPKVIQYKLSEESPAVSVSIDSIREFKVDNYPRFVRATVKIDRSPVAVGSLSTTKEPLWSEETVFLRELTCGKACLWSYIEVQSWFFYSLDGSEPEPLVYKKYHVTNNQTLSGESMIHENAGFRQQLYIYLQNENTKNVNHNNLAYQEAPLVNYFKRYNSLYEENVQVEVKKPEREVLNLKITGFLNYSRLNITDPTVKYAQYDFGGKTNWMGGLELEYFLPFNRNRFSLLFAPTFEHYKNDKNFDNTPRSIDMITVHFPVGGRYGLYLNDNMRFFFDVYYNPSLIYINKNNGFTIISGTLDIKEGNGSWILGGGFAYKQWQIELQYHTTRDLFLEYATLYSDYTKTALSVSYKLFRVKK